MNLDKITGTLAMLEPHVIRDALLIFDVIERWDMSPDEAAEYRGQTLARQAFLALDAN